MDQGCHGTLFHHDDHVDDDIHDDRVDDVGKKLGDLNLSVRTGLGMLNCTLSGGHGMNIRPVGTQAKPGVWSS